jgi:predicted transcriptional regulator
MGVRFWTPAARVLMTLANTDHPMSITEIAEASGIAVSVVSYTIKDLLYNGYVRMVGRKYEITEKGRQVLVVELEKAYSVVSRG